MITRSLKWIGRSVLILLVVAIGVGVWKREQIVRLLAVNSLFSEEKIVSNFSNMQDLFLWRSVPRGDGPISPLPTGPAWTVPSGVST